MNLTIEDILATLKSYNCQYSTDEEGNGINLVDVLTQGEEGTDITYGVLECELLAEHIANELFYRNRG